MLTIPLRSLETVDRLLEDDPWPTRDSWGMSPAAAAAARTAEAVAGGPAPMRDPNAKRPLPEGAPADG